jgi:hypothetical protein
MECRSLPRADLLSEGVIVEFKAEFKRFVQSSDSFNNTFRVSSVYFRG